jgi:predicted nucleotidyltransferase
MIYVELEPSVSGSEFREKDWQMVSELGTNEILEKLKERQEEMRSRFSVRRIGLFGSHVRGTPREATFDHYMDLKFYLEDLLGSSVDLVLFDTIKPRLKPIILREAVYA